MTLDPVTGGLVIGIIGALAAAIVKVIAQLQQINGRQVENAHAIAGIAESTEAIKGHVNSEKTASDGTISALQAENNLLRTTIADKTVTIALLAQAAPPKAPATL
jgi:hypothetical protein